MLCLSLSSVLKYSISLFCFAFPLEIRIFKILGMEEMQCLAVQVVSGLPIIQSVRHLSLCKYSHLESFSCKIDALFYLKSGKEETTFFLINTKIQVT